MLSHIFKYGSYQWNDSLVKPYFAVTEVAGFSSPPIKHSQQEFIGVHGFRDNFSYIGGRVLTFKGRIVGTDEDECMDELEAATLAFRIPGLPSSSNTGYQNLEFWKGAGIHKYISAKVDRFGEIVKDMHIHRARWLAVQFRCQDPLIYSVTEHSQEITPGFLLGGFPMLFPTYFPGDGSHPNDVIVNNAGNFEAPPRYVIFGPCSYPSVTNVTNGRTHTFETDLEEGEYITVTVRPNGLSTARKSDGTDALLTEADDAQFVWLNTGNNTLRYTSVDGRGSVMFYWRDTWYSAPR